MKGVRKRVKRAVTRPKVSWVVDPAAVRKRDYPPYVAERDPSPAFLERLKVGALYIVIRTSTPSNEPDFIRDFPVLWTSFFPQENEIPAGTPFMYAGPFRCKFRRTDGTTIVVFKHTFVGPTGRFIVYNPEEVFHHADDVSPAGLRK